MIDPKLLKQSTNEVSKNLARRGYVFDAEVYLSHEKLRKSLQVENEELKNKRNTVSKEIGIAKSKKKDASVLMKTSDEINSLLAKSEKKLNDVLSKINAIELDLPNLLSDKVPDGNNENDNEIIRNWGKKRSFDFSVKDHVESWQKSWFI